MAVFAASVLHAQKAPFDVNGMLALSRIGEHQISPDGTRIAFSVQTIDTDKNTKPRHVWVVPLRGGAARKITSEGSANSRPRWSPDSKRIAYISDRGGSSQVWTMDPDGSNAKQVTTLSTEADGVLWSGDGKWLVFVSEVYPDCADEACNKRKLDEDQSSKTKARIYTALLYRQWNTYQTARRKHLMVVPAEGGVAKDITPGDRDVPPFSLGGPDGYAVSPDGKEVVYIMNPDAQLATSTNTEMYAVPLEGGAARKLTVNPAADHSPIYSPDGKYLAYRFQLKPGFESDRWRLSVIDRVTGRATVLTDNLDRSVETIAWSADSKQIFFSFEDRGRMVIHRIPVTGGASQIIVNGNSYADEPQFTPDGRSMIYVEMSGSRPSEIFRVDSGGQPVALTHLNDAVLSRYQMTPMEEFSVEGSGGTRVQSFVVKPPNFDATRKYPVMLLIHGGPQGAFGELWHYRWNAQVFAGAGYVVVTPNPRGSTGYGQRFTDEVSGDWGGKAYEDLMAVADHVAKLSYVDPERMVAAGGSYGGYMVNWIQGHTNRFKAFISHSGLFDLRSANADTEELWFSKWEFGGLPWETPEMHEKWSPSSFVKEFKTPTLVIHGELDYRVGYSQALQYFTALQMQKVPSKLLLFPDEGHWITKPQNTLLWYKTFIDWANQWTK